MMNPFDLRDFLSQADKKAQHLFFDSNDNKKIGEVIEELNESNNVTRDLEFSIKGFEMKVIAEYRITGSIVSIKGYYLVISKREKYSLPYICAKALVQDSPSRPVLKRQTSEIISSLAFENIAGSTNLKDAVQNVIKYLEDEYNVNRDDIQDLIKKHQPSEDLLVDSL